MKALRMFHVLLLVMGIFGNLGVALKTQTDQDSDGDDNSDENSGSQEEINAPDNDGSSSGGSAGGAIDIDGLQNSLKEGGVDGLNNMLKSFAATMSSAGSTNSANMHISKDADGHDIYDFRDMAPSSPSTPAHATSAQTLPPPPATQAPSLHSKATPQVENREADAESSNMVAVSSNNERQEGSSSGNVPAAQLGQAVALPLHAATKGMPLTSESHKRDVDGSEKDGSTAQVVLEEPIPPPKFQPKAETIAVTEGTGAPPAAEPKLSTPAERPLPPSNMATASTATGGSIAKLSSSLDEVRRSVDTLLTIALQKQDETPSSDQKQPLALQNQQLSERVGALERENSKLERMFQVQAGRFEAIEAQQQDEEREFGQVLRENNRLRAQLRKSSRHMIRNRSLLQSGSKKMAQKPADHHIPTYYHRRDGGAGQKH